MKHLIIIVISIFFMTSCEKEEAIKYEVRTEAEFIIPSGLNTIETHYITVREVPTFFLLNAQRFNIGSSTSFRIQASKGLLRAKFNDAEFDFVERISVWAVSRSDPSLKREMYYLDFNPLTTTSELRMLSSTTELSQILRDEFIDLELRFNLRRFPFTNIRTVIDFGYAVL